MSERVVIVDWPEVAKRGETLFPGSTVVYANGALPIEALETDDCILVSTDAERLTEFCQQVVAASCRQVRYSTDDISNFKTRQEVLDWNAAGGLKAFTGEPIPNPAPQGDTVEASSPLAPAVDPAGAGPDDGPPEWMDEIPDDLENVQRSIRTAAALKKHAFTEPGPQEWPEPADFWASKPLPAFDPQWITPAIRPFVLNAAACVGCDPGITYLQALAFAAGCVSDEIKVRVRPNQDWSESARLWAMIVGESGDGKSPSMRAIMREAGPLAAEVAQRSKEKHAGYQDELDLYKLERQAWLTRRQKGDPAGARPMPPPKPVNELLYFSGTTSEGLLEQQEATTRGTMLYSDELVGWLFGMDQYKQGGKGSDRQFWLSAWDGAEYVGILVGKLRSIPNTGVTVIGGAQPHAIRTASAKMALDSDGLLQRVLVYNSSGEAREENENPADRDAIKRWRSILHRLYAMKTHLDHCVFSDDAHAIRTEANEWIAKMRSITGLPDAARQALSKWRAYLPRLALTMHAIEAADSGCEIIPGVIDADTMRTAWNYMRDCLWPNLLRFYGILLENGEETRSVRIFAEFVLARDIRTVKPHALASNWTHYRHTFKTIAQRREFFAQAEACGWLRPLGPIDRNKGTAADYQVNPKAFDGRFAAAAMAAEAAAEAYRLIMHPAMLAKQGREPGED